MRFIWALTFAGVLLGPVIGGHPAKAGADLESNLDGRGRQSGHHSPARYARHWPSAKDVGGPRPAPRRHSAA